MYEGEGHIKL
ncbi:Protein of unknown function [Bacillus mycoides]|nr:Protein of unknown function [Bacillus mycoides]